MERPVVTDDVTSDEQLQNEWIAATMRPLANYSVNVAAPAAAAAAGPEAAELERAAEHHFTIVSIVRARSRPRLVHTVESADDPVLTASLAVNVQYQDRWPGAEESMGDARRAVFDDSDPEWCRPSQIAPFHRLRGHAREWKDGGGLQNYPGCVVLRDPKPLQPQFHALDDRCPTLDIFYRLKHRGWQPLESASVTHTTPAIGPMDGRVALRMKAYYQVLYTIDDCMPLASSIPSQEPISFYQLLLRGKPAEPGLGDKHYIVELNADRKARGKLPVPLPPDEEPRAIQNDDDDGLLYGQREPPPPKRKSGGRGPLTGGSGAASSGSAGRAHAEPIPPVAPPVPLPAPPLPPAGPDPPVHPGPPIPVAPVHPEEDDGLLVGNPVPVPVPPPPEARGRRGPKRDWKDGIGGAKFVFEKFKKPDGTFYPNWIMLCQTCPGTCHKTRGSIGRNVARYGEVQPLALLHAWLDMPAAPGKTHADTDPSMAEVGAYVEAHRAELQELVDRYLIM